MTDIVERLRELERVERELAHDGDCPPEATANWRYAETCKEAADEIERLRAALREIASGKYSNVVLPTLQPQDPAVNRARAALRGHDD